MLLKHRSPTAARSDRLRPRYKEFLVGNCCVQANTLRKKNLGRNDAHRSVGKRKMNSFRKILLTAAALVVALSGLPSTATAVLPVDMSTPILSTGAATLTSVEITVTA